MDIINLNELILASNAFINQDIRVYLVAQQQRIRLQCRRFGVQPLGQEVPLEKEMKTNSSVLAQGIS